MAEKAGEACDDTKATQFENYNVYFGEIIGNVMDVLRLNFYWIFWFNVFI